MPTSSPGTRQACASHPEAPGSRLAVVSSLCVEASLFSLWTSCPFKSCLRVCACVSLCVPCACSGEAMSDSPELGHRRVWPVLGRAAHTLKPRIDPF